MASAFRRNFLLTSAFSIQPSDFLRAGSFLESPKRVTETADHQDDAQGGIPEDVKRENVLSLAFGGQAELFEEFCRAIGEVVPAGTTVILRGSAVTGKRWKDGADFDADGPGTSDLDLTLVGDGALLFFKPSGFFVPGIHSRPLSDEDPDIAPDLVPVRRRLMDMVKRPVNIQASRDIVLLLRGDLMGQPYFRLLEKPEGTFLDDHTRA